MDPDAPIPSIERDDLLPLLTKALPTTSRQNHARPFDRMSLDSAAATPLPPSSPLKSPRKTPSTTQRYPFSPKPDHLKASPSSSTSSPTNHDRQSTPPILQSKRSVPNLNSARGFTPSRQSSLRRASSNLNPTSPSPSMKSITIPPEPKPLLTATKVAQDFFTKELEVQKELMLDPETLVIVHDSCYGHRFSRPRISKAGLATIVERPERIHATILGATTAYVRLGERHSYGRHSPHPNRDVKSLPCPFKIRKTSRSIPLNHPSVTHVHGTKWMEELQIMCDSAEGKLALNGKELIRPIGYGKDENGTALPKLHEGDLYLCAESLDALQGCLGGVCDAADSVFSSSLTRRAFVCIRPPGHHCSSNFPSGFCWLNNVHVGIAYAAINHGLTHAAIIDFDLHHGDGSQKIAWEHNQRAQTLQKHAASYKKTPIGYFSLHDINSYPCEMGDEEKVKNASLCIENAHGQSIWNVHLEPWKNLDDFWALYESRYTILLEKTRIFLRNHTQKINSATNSPKARAAIFLSAGFDASEWEGEGMQRHKVNVPTDFYARFTADVVRLAEEEGLGVDGRVISVLEGGYSDRALTSGVLSHICGLATQKTRQTRRSTLSEMEIDEPSTAMVYNPDWWSQSQLEVLEAQINPGFVAMSKKLVDKAPGNYTSPTHASTAKMTDHARERRSLSAQFDARLNFDPEPEKPAPEVDWATASFELSRLIIPKDRQTLSCRHEELNAEATRVRRERQSIIGLPTANEERMQLRDRKSKPLPFEAAQARPQSRGDRRRTTIAAVADLPDPDFSSNSGPEMANGRPRRRSSAGSSIISSFQDMQLNDADRKTIDGPKGGTDSQALSVPLNKVVKAPLVKKLRAATGTKPSVKARPSPKKTIFPAPPVPRVPSAYLARSRSRGSSAEEIVTDQLSSSQIRSASVKSVVKAEDDDKLLTGMKKMSIKLNVRPPEDGSKQQPGTEQERLKKPRAPRKPTVPRAPKAVKAIASAITRPPALAENSIPSSVSDKPGMTKAEEPSLPKIPVTPQDEQTFESSLSRTDSVGRSDVGGIVPQNNPSEGLQEIVDRATIASPVMGIAEATPDTRVSAVESANLPEVPETPMKQFGTDAEAQPKPSTGATPNSMRKEKADLPVFTSSSPIPFAKPSFPGARNIVNSPSRADAISEPEELERVAGPGQGTAIDGGVPHVGASDGMGEVTVGKAKEASIWDIPETPHR